LKARNGERHFSTAGLSITRERLFSAVSKSFDPSAVNRPGFAGGSIA